MKNVKNNVKGESYPILRALNYMQMYKIFRLVIIIFVTSYFLGILWHIYVCDLQTPPMLPDGSVGEYFGNKMLG